jgi:hypothetical protein
MLKAIGGGSVIVDPGRMSLPASPLGRTGRPDLPARPTSTSPNSSSSSGYPSHSEAGSVGSSGPLMDISLRVQVLGTETSGSAGLKQMSPKEFQDELQVARDMGWMDVDDILVEITRTHIEEPDFEVIAQQLVEENQANISVTEFSCVRPQKYAGIKVEHLMGSETRKIDQAICGKIEVASRTYKEDFAEYEEAAQLADAYHTKAMAHFVENADRYYVPYQLKCRPLLTKALTEYLKSVPEQ